MEGGLEGGLVEGCTESQLTRSLGHSAIIS